MKTESIPAPNPIKRMLAYVLAYLLWLVNVAACIVAVIQLRAAINVLWPALGGDRYDLSLINQLVLLVGGLAAFIYIIFLEGHYREAVAQRVEPRPGQAPPSVAAGTGEGGFSAWLAQAGLDLLLRRFAVSTAILVAIIILSFVLMEIGFRLMG